jgi:hypothetical protein
MKHSLCAACAGAVIVLTAPLSAVAHTTYTYPKEHPVLSITFPDDWTVEADPDAEQGLVASSADGAIELDLWALKKEADPKKMLEQREETGQELAELIDEHVTGFKVGESKKGEVNGLKAAMFGGTGKDKEDDEAVNVEVTFLSPDDKQLFGLMYRGSDEAEEANKAALSNISASLKKP